MEESNRQRKIAGVLQKDLVDVLQKAAQDGMQGIIISVSKVIVTSDLGTRNQLRRMPELLFFGDDSLDYIEEIDKSLKGEDDNPIENPDILPKRQKR